MMFARKNHRRETTGLLIALLAAGAAHAHVFGECAHSHIPLAKQWHVCSAPNTACLITPANTCITQRSSIVQAARWCRCVAPQKGCFAAFSQVFITSGIPAQLDTKLYSTEGNEANATEVIYGTDVVIAALDAKSESFGGTFLLDYGDFLADPTAVPVLISDVTLTFPSMTVAGIATGQHTATLAAGPDQFLSYNSVTGELTAPEGGILLDIANDLAEFPAIPVYLEGQVDLNPLNDGQTIVYGNLMTPMPEALLFFDNFEFGGTDAWRVALGLPPVMGLLALLLAWRRWRLSRVQVGEGDETV